MIKKINFVNNYYFFEKKTFKIICQKKDHFEKIFFEIFNMIYEKKFFNFLKNIFIQVKIFLNLKIFNLKKLILNDKNSFLTKKSISF